MMLTAKFLILLLLSINSVRLGDDANLLRVTFRGGTKFAITNWWVLIPLWFWWGYAAQRAGLVS